MLILIYGSSFFFGAGHGIRKLQISKVHRTHQNGDDLGMVFFVGFATLINIYKYHGISWNVCRFTQ